MSEDILRVGADGSFTIVQFTDIHWHNGEPEDLQSRALMEMVLDIEKPDFVAVTGDLVGGEECRSAASALADVGKPMANRSIPWAAVLGNHDQEADLNREELLTVLAGLPGCLSRPGPSGVSGFGNFSLSVANGHGDTAWNFIFLDSNAYAEEGLEGYGWIRHDQIGWFLEEMAQLRAKQSGARRPALCFFHIPLPEYHELWDTGRCLGIKHEHICAPRINTGFFAAMHSTGDVVGAFVGHDHINDYIGDLYGIRLGYGRASGFASYGKEGFVRGARVIRLRAGERTFTSWLRLADGTRVEQVCGV